MIGAIVNKIGARIARRCIPIAPWLNQRVLPAPGELITLGSAYGGWTFVEPARDGERNYAILCGVGEDVSFDLAFQAAFGMHCILVDPTRRAIDHWREVVENATTTTSKTSTLTYNITNVDFAAFEYLPFAVSDKDEQLKFWAPKNPKHVSYSAENIQGSSEFITVPGKTLLSLFPMSSEQIELVKMDIEGVGVRILDWMVANRYFPRQILVEFEECLFPTQARFAALKRSVLALEQEGYALVHFDGQANASFYRIGPQNGPRARDAG